MRPCPDCSNGPRPGYYVGANPWNVEKCTKCGGSRFVPEEGEEPKPGECKTVGLDIGNAGRLCLDIKALSASGTIDESFWLGHKTERAESLERREFWAPVDCSELPRPVAHYAVSLVWLFYGHRVDDLLPRMTSREIVTLLVNDGFIKL